MAAQYSRVSQNVRSRPAVWWNRLLPFVALVTLAATWGHHPPVVAAGVAIVLAATVLVAVHHAEVVAARVGQPFGALVLAVSVTVIEVALIVTLMISGGTETETLARDTVFAAVMITLNGIVGLSLFAGALRFGLARFNAEGSGAMVGTVVTLATVCLVLPTFTTSAHGREFSTSQLVFAGAVSVALYLMFVVTQTVRHREFFVASQQVRDAESRDAPSMQSTLSSLALLLLSLLAVVGLAKVESHPVESAIDAAGLPESFVGVVVALLVLLPETLAAFRTARRGDTQTSLNIAFGSAMASIGLTIPTIAVASFVLDRPLVLGLGPTQIVLLALTTVVASLTVLPGRATTLHAALHLTLLATFVFLAANP